MAQHDYVIANASGASVRADINNMALAISSNNSGSSEPGTKYAYLWWLDTSANVLKLRNSANNAWITMPFSITANNTVDINGGAIDGTPIGASAASTGAFTTFTSNGIDDNADATAITIDSSERVGIGTTSPASLLHLEGSDGVAQIRLQRASTTIGGIIKQTSYGLSYDAFDGNTGAPSHIFRTSTDGTNFTERMRLDASGNVGIGTASPLSNTNYGNLTISGTTGGSLFLADDGVQKGMLLGNNDEVRLTANVGYLRFDTGGNNERMRINSSGNVGIGASSISTALNGKTLQVGFGQISSDHTSYNFNTNFTNNAYQSGNNATFSAITSRPSGVIQLLEDNFIFMNASSGTAGQAVSMSEKIRINGNGKLLLGTTSVLHSNTSTLGILFNGTTDNAIVAQTTRTATGSNFALFTNSSGAVSGTINHNGSTSVIYNTSSDYRLKENIQPLENGLERLSNLKPVKFDWKEDGTSSEGFIAHEAQEVFPDAVSGKKDGKEMQGMDYGRITPLLVKAIQEQQTIIEDLKTRITTLEG